MNVMLPAESGSSGSAPWLIVGGALHSVDQLSESSIALPFYAVGDLQFDATLIGNGGQLSVLVDGVVKLTRVAAGLQRHVLTPLRNGQRITFRFSNGYAAPRAVVVAELRKAIISNVRAIEVERALVACRRCPLGSAAGTPGAASCNLCTANQFAATNASAPVSIGAVRCAACPNNTYSHPSSYVWRFWVLSFLLCQDTLSFCVERLASR
jgi:hypothetical protein